MLNTSLFTIFVESRYDNIKMLQVLLVTGGQKEQEDRRSPILDSTEILEMKENSVWKMSAPLPSPRLGLRAATVGNSLHVFGKTKFFAQLFKCQKILSMFT